VLADNLVRGRTSSCGKTHGMTNTPEFRAWQGLKDRCLNPRSQDYADYGGRGITLCERGFAGFSMAGGASATTELGGDTMRSLLGALQTLGQQRAKEIVIKAPPGADVITNVVAASKG
jgi:hypothetical protein